jgi:sulfatase modifying factor 1
MIRILSLTSLFFLVISNHTLADTFGSGANTFNIEFVTIRNPGNAADTTGDPNPAGSVPYTYRIGQFEISEQMINKANAEAGLGITKDARGPDKPATSVTWNEAARFVNWLNTSSGSPPAYKFAFQPGEPSYVVNTDIQLWTSSDPGYDPNNLYRNSQAKYFLPNVHEWYKAAYYDPTSGVYFDYATGSNSTPTAVASGTAAGTAVYFHQSVPADITLAGGLSSYGTMGQGGNAYEWEETAYNLLNNSGSSSRGTRGGSCVDVSSLLLPTNRGPVNPAQGLNAVGFRVASIFVPEPSAAVLAASISAVLAACGRRRG